MGVDTEGQSCSQIGGTKLLLDENLSRRLIEAIHDLFPGSIHVTQAKLSRATPDRKIWDYALHNGFVILTPDTDFISLANALGPPPRVILLVQQATRLN